jgi:hypothetical protein
VLHQTSLEFSCSLKWEIWCQLFLRLHSHIIYIFYYSFKIIIILSIAPKSSNWCSPKKNKFPTHLTLFGHMKLLFYEKCLGLMVSLRCSCCWCRGRHYVSEPRPPTGLLFVPQMVYEYEEPRWHDTEGGNRRPWRKTCHSATLLITNPTLTNLSANPGLRAEISLCWFLIWILPCTFYGQYKNPSDNFPHSWAADKMFLP